MSICDLPYIVLERILYDIVDNPEYPTREWSVSLGLLSINRLIRSIALPMVYKKAYLISGCKNGSGFNSSYDDIYSKAFSGSTNIGLIKHLNYCSNVKELHVIIHYPQYLDSIINNLQNIFSWRSNNWKGIEKLVVVYSGDSNTEITNSFLLKLPEVTSWFKENIPNISAIAFKSDSAFVRCEEFIRKIIYAYGSQLRQTLCGNMHFNGFTDLGIMIPNNSLDTLNNTNQKLLTYTSNMKYMHIKQSIPQLLHNTDVSGDNKLCVLLFPNLSDLYIKIVLPENKPYDNTDLVAKADNVTNISREYRFPILKNLALSLESIDQLRDILSYDCFQWQNVEKLMLAIRDGRSKQADYSQSRILHHAKSIAVLLKTKLPHIKQFQVACTTTGNANKMFIDMIISCYQNNISKLFMFSPEEIAPIRMNLLTLILINASQTSQLDIVKLSVSTLQSIVMRDVPYSFTWKVLCTNENASKLVFSQLNELVVMYDTSSNLVSLNNFIDFDWHSLADKPFRVCCPKLRSVSVTGTSYNVINNIFAHFDILANVTALEIDYSFDLIDSIDEAVLESCRFSNASQLLGKTILESIPNIRELTYMTNAEVCRDKCFEILNVGYSQQLQTILGDVHISKNVIKYSSRLELLNMIVNSANTVQQPNIYPDCLHDFILIDNSGLFTWQWFNGDMENNAIAFNRLSMFNVQICGNGNDEDDKEDNMSNIESMGTQSIKKVYMPNIESFTLKICNKNTKLPSTELWFGTVKDVKINGPSRSLPIRGNLNSHILNSLEVTIDSANLKDEDNFYNVTNSWFGYRMPLGFSTLILNSVEFKLCPQRLLWQNIARLEFGYSISCTMLLEIIPCLPNLADLLIDILVDDCENFKEKHINPISDSVQMVAVNTAKTTENNKPIGIITLILAITSMLTFQLEDKSVNLIDVTGQYRQAYPHIGNIHFSQVQ